MKTQVSILLIAFMLLVSCKSSVESTPSDITHEVLGPVDFNKKLTTLKNAQLIDVRTLDEVAAGAIPNAVNIDFYKDDFKDQIGKLDKNRPVMVYCKSGGRSGKTGNMLKEMGFKEVYDLKGGYSAWSSN